MAGKTVNKPRQKFRLSITLIVPFVLQIVAAVGLVGYLSFRNGEKVVEDLAEQLSSQVNSRISQGLNNYLMLPRLVNEINLYMLNTRMVKPKKINETAKFFWKQMKLFEQFSYISFCNQEGLYIGIGREDDGSLYSEIIQPSDNFRYQHYALDQDGNPTRLLYRKYYPYQQDEWYKISVKTGKPIWTYDQWPDRPEIISISSSYPVYDSSKQLKGIVGVDFILSQISDFLRTLNIGPSGKIVVIEQDGKIVASSSKEQPYLKINGKAHRLNVSQSQEPLIREVAQQLLMRFGNFERIATAQRFSMKLNQEEAFVSVTPWKDELGLNWLLVMVIPKSDFMEQINANTRNTLWLCLVALGVAIAIGILTARLITNPIIRLTKASEELAAGDLDKQVDTIDLIEIEEIDTLEHSFNRMAGQLKNSFETLAAKNEQLRIAEENYRSIFENALEGIFQSSPEGRYLNANPALAKIYGYNSAAEMIERITNIGEQVYVDPQKRVEFRELLDTQDNAKGFEYRSYCKDGSIIWTQIDARVIKDNQGNVLYYEGIVQDITERKLREDDLIKQLAELKIEIDQQKREKEVAMLTESNYFQEIQQEMAEMNLDKFWS